MILKPEVCRPEAYWAFAANLASLPETDSLWKAAAAVSMHSLDDVSFADMEMRFATLAERVRAGSPSGRSTARLAHLHDVLFEQESFQGDTENYYSSLNSYLPAVLENRLGIPIMLSLVYKVVGERVGLRVEGINSPGHFLVRVLVEGNWLIVDPFFQGQVLTKEEAVARIQGLTGRFSTGVRDVLRTANHYQWLSRVLSNLENIFAAEGRQRDLTAMIELKRLLWESAEKLPQPDE